VETASTRAARAPAFSTPSTTTGTLSCRKRWERLSCFEIWLLLMEAWTRRARTTVWAARCVPSCCGLANTNKRLTCVQPLQVYVQGRAVFERCSFLHNKASSTGGAGVLIKAYCISSNRTVQRCRCRISRRQSLIVCLSQCASVPLRRQDSQRHIPKLLVSGRRARACGRKPSMTNEVLRATRCGGLRIWKDRHFTMTAVRL